MKDKNPILFESKYFWVSDSFEVNLNLGTFSMLIGINKSLDEAKRLIERLERYPKNLKYLIPREHWYQFDLTFGGI